MISCFFLVFCFSLQFSNKWKPLSRAKIKTTAVFSASTGKLKHLYSHRRHFVLTAQHSTEICPLAIFKAHQNNKRYQYMFILINLYSWSFWVESCFFFMHITRLVIKDGFWGHWSFGTKMLVLKVERCVVLNLLLQEGFCLVPIIPFRLSTRRLWEEFSVEFEVSLPTSHSFPKHLKKL